MGCPLEGGAAAFRISNPGGSSGGARSLCGVADMVRIHTVIGILQIHPRCTCVPSLSILLVSRLVDDATG